MWVCSAMDMLCGLRRCYVDSNSCALSSYHDDVIKWNHFPRYWPFVQGIQQPPVNSPHKSLWRVALMFSLICAWLSDWVNSREAGDFTRHCAHYDVIVMFKTAMVWAPRNRITQQRVIKRGSNFNCFFALCFEVCSQYGTLRWWMYDFHAMYSCWLTYLCRLKSQLLNTGRGTSEFNIITEGF